MSAASEQPAAAPSKQKTGESFFSTGIPLKQLIQLLRRLAIGMDAGIDIRVLIQKESKRGNAQLRDHLQTVFQHIDRGDTFAEGLRDCGGYFPPLVCDMVDIGEQTGTLESVLNHLVEYYEHILSLRRTFLRGIAWPAFQLFAAIFVIGMLIWLLGVVGNMTGAPQDILGFGLVGRSGLIRYFGFLAFVAAIAFVAYRVATSQQFRMKVVTAGMKAPVIGNMLTTFALARFSWTLGMAMESGADAQQSLRLALRSTQNVYFTQHAKKVRDGVRQGNEMHEVLRDTQAFPDEFLHSLESSEMSGMQSDQLLRISREYEQRAQSAAQNLTRVATFMTWGGVSLMLVLVIMKLAMFYINTISSFSSGL